MLTLVSLLLLCGLAFIAWSSVLILRAIRRIETYCVDQAKYIEEERTERYCKDKGLVLCPRCKTKPMLPGAGLCNWCGI